MELRAVSGVIDDRKKSIGLEGLSPPKALLLIGYLTDDLGKPQPQPSILQTIRNVNAA